MSDNIGSLAVHITGNASGLASTLKSAKDDVTKFQKYVEQHTSSNLGMGARAFDLGGRLAKGFTASLGKGADGLGSILASATSAATSLPALGIGAAGAIGLGAFVTESIKMAAAVEDTQVTFGVMLGDLRKGKSLFADMKKLAAETPLTTEQITGAGQLLLGNGVADTQLIPTLRILGDIAAGAGTELKDVAMIYGQVRSKGRLYAEEMMQFAERNIPLQAALANTLNVSAAEVSALVSSGRVGFPDLQRALQGMTQEGGQFFGMMETRSKTFNGMLSTLKDNATSFLGTIGQAMIEEFDLKPAMDKLSKVMSLGEGGVDEIRPFLRDVRRLAEYAGDAMLSFLEGAAVGAAEFVNQIRDITGGMADILNGINKATHWLAGTMRDYKPIKIEFEVGKFSADKIKDIANSIRKPFQDGTFGGNESRGIHRETYLGRVHEFDRNKMDDASIKSLVEAMKPVWGIQFVRDAMMSSLVGSVGGRDLGGFKMMFDFLQMEASKQGFDIGKTLAKSVGDGFRIEAHRLTAEQLKFAQNARNKVDPIDAFKKELADIQRIKELGGFRGNGVGFMGEVGAILQGINAENGAIADAFNKAKDGLGLGGPTRLAAGALRGSVEAASLTTRHRLNGDAANDNVPGILRQIRDKIDNQNRENAKIAEALRKAQLLQVK